MYETNLNLTEEYLLGSFESQLLSLSQYIQPVKNKGHFKGVMFIEL